MPKYVELKPAVLPISPSLDALRRFDLILSAVGWMGRLVFRWWIKNIEVIGQEHLQGGAKLILMNHSSPLDPMLLTFFGRKPVQFLVTEPYMADRNISRFAAWMGQIPKRKLDPDTRAIRMLKEWCKKGGNTAIFPEGQFSWDGYPLPLMSGLGELVKYLDVPVVIVRLINADRLKPAWATHLRRTSLRFEIDPPKYFNPAESTNELIEEYVTKHLYVNPDTCTRWPVSGKKFAEGMARFLRFCFSCGADGALSDAGNELRCSQCKKIWVVSGDNWVGEITVAQAWSVIRGHLREKWNANVVCRSQGAVVVMDASRPQWVHLDEGTLILDGAILRTGSWQVEVKDILAHTMDWGDLILLRTERKRIAIRFPQDSRAVWTFALEEALARGKSNAI